MDQINNLQGGSPKPISRPISSKAQNPTEDANKAELSFDALSRCTNGPTTYRSASEFAVGSFDVDDTIATVFGAGCLHFYNQR